MGSDLKCYRCNSPATGVSCIVTGTFEFTCEDHQTGWVTELAEVPKSFALTDKSIERLVDSVNRARAEAEYLRTLVPKRFFSVGDGGVDYSIVAADLEHAKQLLLASGVEMMSKEEDVEGEMFGLSVPVGDPRSAEEWTEITPERAANIRVALGDDGSPPVVPLSECKVGDWFCSEY